jgi:hypothetical protein
MKSTKEFVEGVSMLIRLKAANGQYVVAEGAGGGVVNANRPVPSIWETFTVYDLAGPMLMSGDQVLIGTWDQRHFLCAKNGGGGELTATAEWPRDWATFTLGLAAGDGPIADGASVTLRTLDGHYVSAAGGGGAGVTADAGAVGASETFTLQFVSHTEGPFDESRLLIHLPTLPDSVDTARLIAAIKP